MTSTTKYIGMDVHKESISIAVRNAGGKIAMESVIEAKVDLPPKMRQPVKTHNPLKGGMSHGIVAQAVHARV